MVPEAGSGGHAHAGPRPVPRFFLLGEDIDLKDGGFTNQITVNLPTSGDTTFIYRTGGPSGRELLFWRIRDGIQSKESVDTVFVRWPGLVAMNRAGTNHEFKNQDPGASPGQRHGNVNHWIEPAFHIRVLSAFQGYVDVQPEPRFPLENPDHGFDTRFVITDVSLEWGGLFDVASSPWRNPHQRHRTGRDMDVRSTTMDSTRHQTFIGVCRSARVLCTPEGFHEVPDTIPAHFHLTPRP